MSRRGTTRLGQTAPLPDGDYQPSALVQQADGAVVVAFHGEDGRCGSFPVDRLPLPGWHSALAAAFAERTGPDGAIRTLSSARHVWFLVGRFIRFIAALPQAPSAPAGLQTSHLQAWFQHRITVIGETYACTELRSIGRLLTTDALRDQVGAQAVDFTQRLSRQGYPTPEPGYSDRELRLLINAARADVARLRDRVRGNEAVLEQFGRAPDSLDADRRDLAGELAELARHGEVQWLSGPAPHKNRARKDIGGQLFVTFDDVVPLMVLGVAVTGRNIETLKELPAEHRIIEDRAVEVRIIKRRRGQRRWHETVTWEIGPPGRELHTPGGFYLLLLELTRRSRGFCGSRLAWSIWRQGGGRRGADEHRGLFDGFLHKGLESQSWVARHDGLTADTAAMKKTSAEKASGAEPVPLHLDFTRLRTTIEVRRTRQLGGHMPSAARSNTVPVLFSNYLRGDPTVVDWAHDLIGEALLDAERSALVAHRRALEATGGTMRIVSGADPDHPRRDTPSDQEPDTAWTACAGHGTHPATGASCTASFLDCFQCGNCLITPMHLPKLLGLVEAMAARRRQMSQADWWARYGMAWAAIHHEVLPRFSPAEVAHAAATTAPDTLLDLVEAPWEQP